MTGPALLLALTSLSTTGVAEETESGLTARQLFYTERKRPAKPAAPATTSPPGPQTKPQKHPPRQPARKQESKPAAKADGETYPPWLGLRYSVLQVSKQGRAQEVNPDQVFREGDAIRLKVTPNSNGYLYIVHQGSSGNWEVLFPTADVRQGNNEVARLETVTVPGGEQVFEFDEKPGTERLFVVLSAKPEQNLDSLIYSLKKETSAGSQRVLIASSNPMISAQLIDQFRSGLVSRDLKVERRPRVQGSAQPEEAVYIVNAADTKDRSRVVAEITLKHQ